VAFVWIAISTTAVARYLVMFEPAGWLSAGWLVQAAVDCHRLGAPTELLFVPRSRVKVGS
jgi:hypothetical protein